MKSISDPFIQNLYSKRDLALNEFMNPFSTKEAVNEMLKRGEIRKTTRMSAFSDCVGRWTDRHPILTALIALPLFWALIIGIASL